MEKQPITEQARFLMDSIHEIEATSFSEEKRLQDVASRYGEYGEISLPQVHACIAVHEHGQVSVKDLAEALNVSPPTVSVMTDRLVEKGLFFREQDEKDRRKVLIRLTPMAADMIEDMNAAGLQVFVDIVQKIGPETTKKWIDVIKAIRRVQQEAAQVRP